MTEHPTTPDPIDQAARIARQARVAALAQGRSTKRRHPAQGARIAAAGIGATTLIGLVGVMGYNARPTPAPAPAPAPAAAQPPVIVLHRPGTPDTVAATAPSSRSATNLTARPTVRPASPQAQAPAASTRGSG